MSHVRTQIRAQLAQILTGLPTTGTNVFPNRVAPIPPNLLPALCIYTTEEASGLDSATGLRREMNVVVEAIFATTEAAFDAEADRISAEVETALGTARRLNNLAYDCVPVGMRLALNQEGESKTGHCAMTFRVTTRTALGAPETALV